jgi:hypothetical protein
MAFSYVKSCYSYLEQVFSVQHEIIEHMHCNLQIDICAVMAICVQDECNNSISHGSTVAVSGLDIQAEWNGENSRRVSQSPAWLHKQGTIFLISNFRRVQYVVCFLLGNSPASEFYRLTFQRTLSVPSS